jgi:hypothetical protein
VYGYSDWKHINGMAKVHDKCHTHKLALTKYNKGYLDSKTQGSVSIMIDSQLKIEVERNRLVLRSLIKCALYVLDKTLV